MHFRFSMFKLILQLRFSINEDFTSCKCVTKASTSRIEQFLWVGNLVQIALQTN